MNLVSSCFRLAQITTSTALSVAKMPYELIVSMRPTIVKVEIGFVSVGEDVTVLCTNALKRSFMQAPANPNVKLHLELVDKDFLLRFPVTEHDMFKVARKLQRNILKEVGHWLHLEDSNVQSNSVALTFTPKMQHLELTA